MKRVLPVFLVGCLVTTMSYAAGPYRCPDFSASSGYFEQLRKPGSMQFTLTTLPSSWQVTTGTSEIKQGQTVKVISSDPSVQYEFYSVQLAKKGTGYQPICNYFPDASSSGYPGLMLSVNPTMVENIQMPPSGNWSQDTSGEYWCSAIADQNACAWTPVS